MTELTKSRWESDGDNIRFSMPLSKVDKKNRLVSGWATLDNVDTQGDIVTADASAKAFARARGNLREMHQPIAVGKIVDFREDEFFNEQDGKFYRGIFVTARVSEGAEDTWTKVLDETLTGFSIGGSIIDASNEMSKDGSGQVRIVKDYDLVELSLVDNPANQLANVFSIHKTATGSVNVEGMVAETKIESVFICKADGTIMTRSDDEAAECFECGGRMENIGWFETGKNRAEKVRDIVAKFKNPNLNKGGDEMSEKITKNADEANAEVEETVAETEESAEVEAVEPVEEETETVDTETADVEEVTDDEEVISKKIDELKEVVSQTLEAARTDTKETIQALETKIEEINKSFMTKASELEKKFDEFGDKLTTEKNRLSELETKLDKMNSGTAVKKSAELELEKSAEANVQKKTTWDGAFSIDNLR